MTMPAVALSLSDPGPPTPTPRRQRSTPSSLLSLALLLPFLAMSKLKLKLLSPNSPSYLPLAQQPSSPKSRPFTPFLRTAPLLLFLGALCLLAFSLFSGRLDDLVGQSQGGNVGLRFGKHANGGSGSWDVHDVRQAAAPFRVGTGIGDITGPVVEVNMMGYASLPQTNTGLHMRLRSRAFIVADANENGKRWAFINGDICMGDTAIRQGVIDRLSALYPGVYDNTNVAMVGTHSHAGVAGFLNYLLPQITSLGFVRQTYDAIVDGSVLAVQRAHESLGAGNLRFGNTTLLDTNINRSPYSYDLNPAEEKARYQYNQDKEFALLRFDNATGGAKGFLSWFPVHGTSLYENNTLTSSDNKGLAAFMYESYQQPAVMPGNNTFVAGFSQANVGDTSPNTLGAFCDDGSPCDYEHSTCNGRVETCHGRGPAWGNAGALAVSPTGSYDFASNEIIAANQFGAARSIMEGSGLTALTGADVVSVHTYVNMSNYAFALFNGTTVHTCPAALGYGFAGGTTDGPGAFDFVQGDNSSDTQNPFWQIVKAFVKEPSEYNKACQYPKPILLDIGEMHAPYDWGPAIVDIQMFRAGNLVVLVVPGEFTTMAGRRIKEAVAAALVAHNITSNPIVQISGPANTYGHYVATREEYTAQRYEGASTLFGPFTLEAYIDIYTKLVPSLAAGAAAPPAGPSPPIFINQAISLVPGVVYDSPGLGRSFGQVLKDVPSHTFTAGTGNASATFIAADPRNSLRLEDTFLAVQMLRNDDGLWKTVRTDGHNTTTIRWTRTNTVTGESTMEVAWAIEKDAAAGTYRLQYNGDSKSVTGTITPFSGYSSNFTVTA